MKETTQSGARPANRALRQIEVAARYGVVRETIWHWCRRGDFPAPFKVGRVPLWREADLDAHDAARAAAAQVEQRAAIARRAARAGA